MRIKVGTWQEIAPLRRRHLLWQDPEREGIKMSTLFLSHAHEDADLAADIAGYIGRSLPNVYEIFRSTDLRAIPAGRWLATLTDKLRSATCVIVLVTPASKAKPWLFFETGFAAGIGRDPIPVCARGIKVEDLKEPL